MSYLKHYYSLVEYTQKTQNFNYQAVTIKSDGTAERVNYAQVDTMIQQMNTMLPPKVQLIFFKFSVLLLTFSKHKIIRPHKWSGQNGPQQLQQFDTVCRKLQKCDKDTWTEYVCDTQSLPKIIHNNKILWEVLVFKQLHAR